MKTQVKFTLRGRDVVAKTTISTNLSKLWDNSRQVQTNAFPAQDMTQEMTNMFLTKQTIIRHIL